MTKREDQLRERIYSVEEQLVKAAILLTEAREERDAFRAALDKGPAASVEAQAEINHWRERAEAAEQRITELVWQVNNMRNRAEAAEKRIKELEPIVTMREQELMGELVRERGLVQVSHKRETAMRDLLMRFIPADRHDEVRAVLEAKP